MASKVVGLFAVGGVGLIAGVWEGLFDRDGR